MLGCVFIFKLYLPKQRSPLHDCSRHELRVSAIPHWDDSLLGHAIMFFGCLFVVLILYVYTVINEIYIKKGISNGTSEEVRVDAFPVVPSLQQVK